MAIYKKIKGTSEQDFQFGLSGGIVKNSGGVLETRNAADSDYAVHRGAHPISDNDFATKKFVETLDGFVIVSGQANTSVSIPDNTAVKRNVVVTTAGSGVFIGDLLYDNGLNDALPMEVIVAAPNRTIATTQAFAGGTVTFDADSIYTWDSDGSSWIKIGDIGSLTGAIRVLRFAIDNTAVQDTASTIPLNARILNSRIEPVTPYSGGGTIAFGTTAVVNKFADVGDNNPQLASIYEVEQDTDQGAATVARITVGGTPAAGAGFATLYYSAPNA